MELTLFRKLITGSIAVAVLAASAAFAGSPGTPESGTPTETLTARACDLLRSRIETARDSREFSVGTRRINSPQPLEKFYTRRLYQPVWGNDTGPLPEAQTLVQLIHDAVNEGLNPDDYHLAEIEERIRQLRQGVARKNQADTALCFLELDLLLTDAYLTYAADLKTGRVENPKWHAHILEEDLSELLQDAVSAGRIEPSLKDLLPKHESYNKLAKFLTRYRTVSYGGGWGVVQEGPTMRLGDRGDRVKSLRVRLLISDDYEGSLAGDLALFDEDLLAAVKKFQLRHGLEPDGLVGEKTLEALNVPVEERIRQIKVNMERWRWLPNLLGDRYILVNIANFQTDVVEGNTTVLSMKSIVGREFRNTPVFSDKMTYLVLNPYWNVPRKLAVEDIIPLVRKDPGHLAKKHMKVMKGWGADESEVDPDTIDWSKMNEDNFPYRFRQDPGPYNALGRIKFMFPNEHAVYLHDTPAKGLFDETSRDLSSGCIRIDKPLELAEYLLSEDPAWDWNRIVEALDTKADLSVRLPRPINIHILYWTSWIDKKGFLNFRSDVYGRDRRVYEALYRP